MKVFGSKHLTQWLEALPLTYAQGGQRGLERGLHVSPLPTKPGQEGLPRNSTDLPSILSQSMLDPNGPTLAIFEQEGRPPECGCPRAATP